MWTVASRRLSTFYETKAHHDLGTFGPSTALPLSRRRPLSCSWRRVGCLGNLPHLGLLGSETVDLRIEANQPHRRGELCCEGGGLVGHAVSHREVDERASCLPDEWTCGPGRGVVLVLAQVGPTIEQSSDILRDLRCRSVLDVGVD